MKRPVFMINSPVVCNCESMFSVRLPGNRKNGGPACQYWAAPGGVVVMATTLKMLRKTDACVPHRELLASAVAS
jgi:hypothetical protein